MPLSRERRLLARLARRTRRRRQKIEVAHADCLRKFVDSDDCWIALAALKATQILLTEPRYGLDLLLRQATRAPKACEILSHKLAHVHVDLLAEYAL
jgi:hypothetical protein